MTWNDFFISTCAICLFNESKFLDCVFFLLDLSITEFHKDELKNLLDILETFEKLTKSIKELVDEFDIDKDGILSQTDFIDMMSSYPKLFQPIKKSREFIKKITLGISEWNVINHRYIHIKEIKDYRKDHNNKFPSDDCLNWFIRTVFTHQDNPERYDYEMRHDVGKGIVTEIQQYLEVRLKNNNPNDLKKQLKHCNTSFLNTPDIMQHKVSQSRSYVNNALSGRVNKGSCPTQYKPSMSIGKENSTSSNNNNIKNSEKVTVIDLRLNKDKKTLLPGEIPEIEDEKLL